MLIALQFPIADGRGFLKQAPARLPLPSWPIPIPETEFVRSFGIVRRRARGYIGLETWSDDFLFSSAASAFKFPDLGVRRLGELRPTGAFRRLFCDGAAVARVEVGLGMRARVPLDGDAVLRAVKDFLDLPTEVTSYSGKPLRNPFQLQGPSLAKLYFCASSRTKDLASPGALKYTTACEPMMLVDYFDATATGTPELAALPAKCRTVDPQAVGGVALSYTKFMNGGKSVGIWFVGHGAENKDAARRLRLCLFRLHAEQQVLAQVLRWMAQGAIGYEAGSSASESLESYLNTTTRVIFQDRRNGMDQGAIRDVLAAYEWVMGAGERDLLFQLLGRARRQVLQKVKRFTEPRPAGVRDMYVSIYGNTITEGQLNIMANGTQQIVTTNYGSNNVFHGDAIAAGNITESFNTASKAPNSEIQDALQALTKNIAQLCEKLGGAEQQTVSRRLKQLAEEAVAPQPDKSFLQVTGKGLVEAAKTVAEMVGPITTAVKGVLALFGLAL